MRRVTLLTDFGTVDGYVAAMKGVIASIAPGAAVEDAAHDLSQGDVEAAAWTLWRYWRLYPSGTVHLVVVDPGVGTARRAIAARVEGRFLVAPDNGVLSRVFDDAAPEAVVALENEEYRRADVSATFHGRDVFAPAAAHLVAGARLAALGPTVPDPVRLEAPRPERRDGRVRGRVVHVDRFGNLVTNIPGDWAREARRVYLGDREVGPVRRTYGDVGPGDVVALIGSTEMLEISIRDGSAAATLGARRGAEVGVDT